MKPWDVFENICLMLFVGIMVWKTGWWAWALFLFLMNTNKNGSSK